MQLTPKIDMFEVSPCNVKITIGDGNDLKATHKGKKKLMVIQPDNRAIPITIQDVYYVPGLHCNLFSITSALSGGAKLGNEGLHLTLSKKNSKIIFDQVIKNSTGYVVGIKTKKLEEMALSAVTSKPKIELNLLHQQLGHPNMVYTLETAKKYGWETFGEWRVCEDCAICKAKQKNVIKITKHPSNIPGERLYLDLSSVQFKLQALVAQSSGVWLLMKQPR